MVPAQSASPMDPPGQHEAGMCGHVCASECSQSYVCMSTSTHRVFVLSHSPPPHSIHGSSSSPDHVLPEDQGGSWKASSLIGHHTDLTSWTVAILGTR